METGSALRGGILCGIISILVDIDHPIALAYQTNHPEFTNFRFLHPLFVAIASLLLLYFAAYCGRLHAQYILMRAKELKRGT